MYGRVKSEEGIILTQVGCNIMVVFAINPDGSKRGRTACEPPTSRDDADAAVSLRLLSFRVRLADDDGFHDWPRIAKPLVLSGPPRVKRVRRLLMSEFAAGFCPRRLAKMSALAGGALLLLSAATAAAGAKDFIAFGKGRLVTSCDVETAS
jgi:hypothetical protein